MRKRKMFLIGILALLLFLIFAISLGSKMFIFDKLEPAFVGALVGAAGTIFAACIAYTMASQNLEAANKTAEDNAKQRIENEKQQKVWQVRQATTELSQLREALAYVDKFINRFDGASEVGPRDYVAFYKDIYQAGGVTSFMGSTPETFRPRLQQEFSSIQMMQNPLNMLSNKQPNDPSAAEERLTLSRNIRERLADLRKLRGEIDEDIRRRERDVDAMNRGQP